MEEKEKVDDILMFPAAQKKEEFCLSYFLLGGAIYISLFSRESVCRVLQLVNPSLLLPVSGFLSVYHGGKEGGRGKN